MIATRQNQTVAIIAIPPIRDSGLPDGTMLNLAMDQEQEQDSQQKVHAHESQQREEAVSRRDTRRKAVGGAHQAVDQPRLAA